MPVPGTYDCNRRSSRTLESALSRVAPDEAPRVSNGGWTPLIDSKLFGFRFGPRPGTARPMLASTPLWHAGKRREDRGRTEGDGGSGGHARAPSPSTHEIVRAPRPGSRKMVIEHLMTGQACSTARTLLRGMAEPVDRRDSSCRMSADGRRAECPGACAKRQFAPRSRWRAGAHDTRCRTDGMGERELEGGSFRSAPSVRNKGFEARWARADQRRVAFL